MLRYSAESVWIVRFQFIFPHLSFPPAKMPFKPPPQPTCQRCNKAVYPTELLKCLDKVRSKTLCAARSRSRRVAGRTRATGSRRGRSVWPEWFSEG